MAALVVRKSDQDVQHVAVLVNGSPQVVGLAVDLDEQLVEMPFIARAWRSAPQLIREDLTELAAPLVDGLVAALTHP